MGAGASAPRAEAAERRLQVALGVDQEVGADDDPLAGSHALADLDVAVGPARRASPGAARSGPRRARSAPPAACRCRSPPSPGPTSTSRRPTGASISTLAYMSGLSRSPGVGDLDAHPRRAGLLADRRVDEGDAAGERPVRIGLDGDRRRLADRDGARSCSKTSAMHPDRRDVGDPVERLARHEAHALERQFFDHRAAHRRGDRHLPAPPPLASASPSPLPESRDSEAAARRPRGAGA